MSAHSVVLLLCIAMGLISIIFGSAAFYWRRRYLSAIKQVGAEKLAHERAEQGLTVACAILVVAFTRISELETIGYQMYVELKEKAYELGRSGYIVSCLEKRVSDLVSQTASMNARRLTEEKRAVGAKVIELLIGFFYPAKCGAPGV